MLEAEGLSTGRDVRRGRNDLLDGVGIGVSFICLVHCLALPILIAFLPAWSAWLDVPEALHFYLLLFALPFSLIVLWQAGRRRFTFRPFAAGSAGLLLMTAALGLSDPYFETALTVAGALLLAVAHVMNWRLRLHRH